MQIRVISQHHVVATLGTRLPRRRAAFGDETAVHLQMALMYLFAMLVVGLAALLLPEPQSPGAQAACFLAGTVSTLVLGTLLAGWVLSTGRTPPATTSLRIEIDCGRIDVDGIAASSIQVRPEALTIDGTTVLLHPPLSEVDGFLLNDALKQAEALRRERAGGSVPAALTKLRERGES